MVLQGLATLQTMIKLLPTPITCVKRWYIHFSNFYQIVAETIISMNVSYAVAFVNWEISIVGHLSILFNVFFVGVYNDMLGVIELAI